MEKQTASELFSLQDGSVIALRAGNGRLVSRIHYGGGVGKNHLEVAKSRLDVFCHLTILALGDQKIALRAENGHYICHVEKTVTSALCLEDGYTFYRKQETFLWIMAEACSLDQASRWFPLEIGPKQVAFQAENGLFLGYKASYCFDTRLPLFLASPQADPEFQTGFGLRVLSLAQQKPSNNVSLDTHGHPPLLRSIRPWRSANRWFDLEDFDDAPLAQSTHLSISAFLIRAGDIVDGIQSLYSEKFVPLTPPHGNIDGYQLKIELEPGDRWSEISGFSGDWFGGNYVLQLTFHTHQGKVHGPFGSMNYAQNIQPFRLIIQPDEEIVAFSGVVSSGDNGRNRHLGALGLILRRDAFSQR